MVPKVVVITGGTGVIGKAIAFEMAKLKYSTVIIARDIHKAKNVIQEIKKITGNPNVWFEIADISRKSDVQALASRWEGPLHVLINNAAVTPINRLETKEGIELQFATNVLGYFWMTQSFLDILQASAPSRIVDISSYWAGGLDLSDLEFILRPYKNSEAYRQSKQANRMLTAAWAKRLTNQNIVINACHPGDVNSRLSNNLGFNGSQSPQQSAKTPVWLATGTEGGFQTGKYFENRKEMVCTFSQNEKAIEDLFEICLSYS